MILVNCPDRIEPVDVPYYDVLFLAGGISGCRDWQKEMIERLKVYEDLIVLNPRRADFDVNDPSASSFQIEWEFEHLQKATAVLFWFPFETLCPITLYELGVCATRGNQLFVGCHPAYQRKFDVEKQLSLLRPDVKVHTNFADVLADFHEFYMQPEYLAAEIARMEAQLTS